MEIYQDIVVKGNLVKKGIRPCEERYNAVRSVCQLFNRPVTVLDIGANLGYFSFKLAQEFKGTFVMIEGGKEEQDYLLTLCKLNDNQQIVLLNKRITLEDLNELASTEHFDITLALSVLHHFNEPLDQVFRAMTRLGNYLVIEMPHPQEHACNQSRVQREPLPLHEFRTELLAQTPTHTAPGLNRDTILVHCPQKTLDKPYWGWMPHNSYYQKPEIVSTHELKYIQFQRKPDARHWIDGINFSTFIALKGNYPTKHKLIQQLKNLDTSNSTDTRQWNMILSRHTLTTIDHKDPQAPPTNPQHERNCLHTIIQRFQNDQLEPNAL